MVIAYLLSSGVCLGRSTVMDTRFPRVEDTGEGRNLSLADRFAKQVASPQCDPQR